MPEWTTVIPCRPEVLNVLQFIHDSLTAARLLHCIEQDVENPDVHVCYCHDRADHMNAGLVGWDAEAGRVRFYCYDPSRVRHEVAEGVVPGPDSVWCWDAKSAVMFVDHLNGTVRQVLAGARAQLDQLDDGDEDGDGDGDGDGDDEGAEQHTEAA